MTRFLDVQNKINAVGYVLLIVALIMDSKPIAAIALSCFVVVLWLYALAAVQMFCESKRKGG